ncbi:hypothetical protein [Nucisporomicrobium flavum]|uniref:hypothetical protein n=1 Tax=Nucisporomicrobium flavum TaxID=2785915 RepID=UPI001F31C539|nr:hypothetical protein [Nucisporomicrobium flavum]
MPARILDETLAFLETCATAPQSIGPGELVDIGWHTFIRHTREYADFCDRIAGRFIHHVPDDGPTGEEWPTVPKAEPAMVATTVAAMRRAGHRVDLPLWSVTGTADCTQPQPSGGAPLPRCGWDELPFAVRAAVEAHTGPILRATSVVDGSVSDFAAVLEARRGRLFCKGAVARNPLGWMHRNEARVNPYLPVQVPRLRWHIEADGWTVVGFECVEGRYPDVSPGSPDLPAVAATLSAMAAALTPCPVPFVQAAVARWAGWVAPDVVDGQTLVHTDVTPRNFLAHGRGVTVVDWSMPCRGAAWIDTALMVVRLIRAGHTPGEAQAWADQIPVWSSAEPAAIDLFAGGVAALSLRRQQQRPSADHLAPLVADAAAFWARHRDNGKSRRSR